MRGKALKNDTQVRKYISTSCQDSTEFHLMTLGYGDGNISLMRFIPMDLDQIYGDIVVWIQEEMVFQIQSPPLTGGKEPDHILVKL